MSTIYISKIFDRALRITGAGNTKAELLDWFNEGETTYVIKKPDSYTKTADQLMIAGTKQTLASDGILFLEPICNLGLDGSTFGAAVFTVDKAQMDRSQPGWHGATADTTIEAVIFNQRNPKVFYISPPQPTENQSYLRYEYSALPPEIIVTDNDYDVIFNLSDECAPNMLNYLLFRLYSKDSGQIADAVQRASLHWSLFTGDIVDREGIETRDDPNNKRGV